MKRTLRDNIRGGTGQAVLTELASSGDFPLGLKLAATLELLPGCSIGLHEHIGEAELYYCISGNGILNDNDCETDFSTGDLSITYSGERHGVTNTGLEKLRLFALIINTTSTPRSG